MSQTTETNPRNKRLNVHTRYSDRPFSKIRSRNLCIQPFRENWIPGKFSAIRYLYLWCSKFYTRLCMQFCTLVLHSVKLLELYFHSRTVAILLLRITNIKAYKLSRMNTSTCIYKILAKLTFNCLPELYM